MPRRCVMATESHNENRSQIVAGIARWPRRSSLVAACGDERRRSASSGPASGGERIAVGAWRPSTRSSSSPSGSGASGCRSTQPHAARGRAPRRRAHARRTSQRVADADLVVYLEGFSPAVDDAVAQYGVRTSGLRRGPACRPRPDLHARSRRARSRPTSRRHGPALLARPDPARRRWPTRSPPGSADLDPAHAPGVRGQRRGAARRPRRARRRAATPAWPTCTNRRPGHQPQRLRLPGRALRPRARSASPASRPTTSPRPRAWPSVADFVRGPRRRDDLLRDAREPGGRRDRRGRDRRRDRGARPDRGSRPATPRAPTTSSVMRANLASLRGGQPCP